jgi:hypothetical protein
MFKSIVSDARDWTLFGDKRLGEASSDCTGIVACGVCGNLLACSAVASYQSEPMASWLAHDRFWSSSSRFVPRLGRRPSHRYGNDPGPRQIKFLTHLLKYLKYAKKDRLIFKAYEGKRDHESYIAHLQLHFQCDADLGGNLDNGHSQTSYLGLYAGAALIKGVFRHQLLSQRSNRLHTR